MAERNVKSDPIGLRGIYVKSDPSALREIYVKSDPSALRKIYVKSDPSALRKIYVKSKIRSQCFPYSPPAAVRIFSKIQYDTQFTPSHTHIHIHIGSMNNQE